MVVVLREGGLRVVIYKEDHEPPHVHVRGDGETKVELGDAAPLVIWSTARKGSEIRRARLLVAAHAAYFRQKWDELHG